MIVCWDIDPSQEAALVPDRLDQAGELGTVESTRFDAGDHAEGVITATTERRIERRCPAGRTLPDGDATRPDDKPYSKAQFIYQAASDAYRCPAGASLTAGERYPGKTPHLGYVRYRTRAGTAGEQRPRCTTRTHGRTLKRYPSDDANAALRQAMADPDTQQALPPTPSVGRTRFQPPSTPAGVEPISAARMTRRAR